MNYYEKQEQKAMEQVAIWLWAVAITVIGAVLYRVAQYLLN